MTTASPTTPPTADSPVVLRSDDDRIATLTLDSPENRNALSSRLVGELAAHLRDVEADDAVRAVVLTHTGNTFCAGADLAEGARGCCARSSSWTNRWWRKWTATFVRAG